MAFTINFDEPQIVSVDKWFGGQTEKGHKFMIHANWNDWDDWTVDDVVFEDESDVDEELKEEIAHEFMVQMNE
jgi:hypothetical protein